MAANKLSESLLAEIPGFVSNRFQCVWGRFWPCLWPIPVAFWADSSFVLGRFQQCFGSIPGKCWVDSSCLLGRFWVCFWSISDVFWIESGCVLGRFQECFGRNLGVFSSRQLINFRKVYQLAFGTFKSPKLQLINFPKVYQLESVLAEIQQISRTNSLSGYHSFGPGAPWDEQYL